MSSSAVIVHNLSCDNGPMGAAAHARQPPRRWWQGATPTWRVLLVAASAGVLAAAIAAGMLLATGYPHDGDDFTRPDSLFEKARGGDCLMWPLNSPDQISIVSCANEHRFEVAQSVDRLDAEHDAASGVPMQQRSEQQCQSAVQRYLGAHYDPNGRFTAGVLWSGNGAPANRRMLCGLQWPGPGYQQLPFTGRVSELDQSRVWPAGTCLGIGWGADQRAAIPVDCSGPHAMEVTGSVDLADKFAGPPPADADQRAFVTDSCTRTTDAYLAPAALSSTPLTLTADTIPAPSWMAGTRRLACTIAAPRSTGGWAVLVGSAKGPLSINGEPVSSPAIATASPSVHPAPPSTAPNAGGQTTAPSQRTHPPTPPVATQGSDTPTDTDNPPIGPAPGPVDNPQPPEQPAAQPPAAQPPAAQPPAAQQAPPAAPPAPAGPAPEPAP
jgi:Septum formation